MVIRTLAEIKNIDRDVSWGSDKTYIVINYRFPIHPLSWRIKKCASSYSMI